MSLVDTIRDEAAYRFNPPPKAKGYPWGEVVTYPLLVFAAHLPLSLFALLTLRPSFSAKWDDRGQAPPAAAALLDVAEPAVLVARTEPQRAVRPADQPRVDGVGVMGLL